VLGDGRGRVVVVVLLLLERQSIVLGAPLQLGTSTPPQLVHTVLPLVCHFGTDRQTDGRSDTRPTPYY